MVLERSGAGAPFVGPVPFFQFGALPLEPPRGLGTSPLHVLPLPRPRLERLLQERAREGKAVVAGRSVFAAVGETAGQCNGSS